jgi:DNA-binding transcriptional ArsR family regulator
VLLAVVHEQDARPVRGGPGLVRRERHGGRRHEGDGRGNSQDQPHGGRYTSRAGVPESPGRDRLTYSYIGIYIAGIARAATTADTFNAIAEPRRREILDALGGEERSVNELVSLLGLAQPQVSKHLRVLREVGAVDVREDGRRRLYRLNGPALKPVHDWVKNYEQLWSERFDELDVVLDDLKQKEQGDGSSGE